MFQCDMLTRYFCSDTVFNLSNWALSESKIKVLEKGLDFAPIQKKINEPELRRDFQDVGVWEPSAISKMNQLNILVSLHHLKLIYLETSNGTA